VKWMGGALNSGTYLHAVTGVMLVLGGYLTYAGFRARPA